MRWLLTLLALPLVSASPLDIIGGIWSKMLYVGSLSFLGVSGVVGFTRILIWILVFALFFAVSSWLTVSKTTLFKRSQAMMVAAVIATISAIFLPVAAILTVGAGWATLIALILIGAPIIGLAFVLYQMPNQPCSWRFLKFIVSLILLWILSAMKEHLQTFSVQSQVQQSIQEFIGWALIIVILLVLYYLLSWLRCGTNQGQLVDQGKGIRKFVRKLFSPKTPTRRLGPAPPLNNPKPPRKNKGDDPEPSPRPPAPDPISGPLPGVPLFVPKQSIHTPKDKRVQIDLSPWFLSIRNQDGLGACAAFAAGSIVEYLINRALGKLSYDYKLSELFLWYNARADQASDSGTYPQDIIREVLKGDCKETLWEFEEKSSAKYLQRPSSTAYNDAPLQRALEVNNVLNDPNTWIQALADGHPICIGIATPDNFDGSSLRGVSLFDNPRWPSRGGHRMVIVGYDSHYPKGASRFEAFKVRNSWGKKWGEEGNIWIPAAILKDLIYRNGGSAFILKTWANHTLSKTKYSIKGRVVFDFPDQPISSSPTGAELYSNQRLMAPDHDFVVGVIAQIRGNLEVLQEIVVSNRTGYFYIEFDADISSFEQPTKLSKVYPKQFSHLDFTKLPAGVVVYKKSKDNSQDEEMYFHIVEFKYSFAGRGGEAELHPENPCTNLLDSHRQLSGRPIVFSESHKEEKNVILPVIMYSPSAHNSKITATAKKIERIAQQERGWAGTEFKFLEELEKDLINQKFDKIRNHQLSAARTQRGLFRLQNRLDGELKELIEELPPADQNLFKTIRDELNALTINLLKFTSRQRGELWKSLDNLHIQEQNVRIAPKISPEKKKILEQGIKDSCITFAAKITELMQWSNGLSAKLEELEQKTKELVHA